ncbi:molybdopterin-dependent oxidoreductase [Psychrobacter phenylpyruvicus]|uniref:molybdopterin-dependent oxidoreductase n=1 Tax=Psychrobacter phenylpyruvicus TaxID=29432 RepID=UPI00226599B3|nr:molybdopterin-dependent oxidoreductase [Psychrobacter phenylpyruvicus]
MPESKPISWVEIKPFEFDQYPTKILDGVPGIIYSPSRVRYPMVRVDWYKNRHKSDTSQRGDNRFVRVSWDEALDLVYEELERIQKDYGPGRYTQQTLVGAR